MTRSGRGSRSILGGDVPVRSYRLALVLLFLTQGVLVWQSPGTDPFPVTGVTAGESARNAWAVMEARSWTTGQDLGLEWWERRPLFSCLQWAVYAVLGISSWSAGFLCALSAMLVTALIVGLVHSRYGRGASVTAGSLCALNPAWSGFGRTASVEQVAGLAILGLLALGVRGGVRRGFAIGASATCALLLHWSCAIPCGALVMETWRGRGGWFGRDGGDRVSERSIVGFLILAGSLGVGSVIAVGLGVAPVEIPRLPGEDLARYMPVVLIWAWVSTLVSMGHRSCEDAAQLRFDRLSLTTLWGGLPLLLLVGDGGVTSSLPVVPLALVHAGIVGQRVLWLAEGSEIRLLTPRGVRAGTLGLLGSYFIIGLCSHTTVLSGVSATTLGLAVALLGVVHVLVLPLLATRVRSPWLPAGGVVFAAILWLPLWMFQFGHAADTTRAASAQMPAVLLPTAVLTGPCSALLALDNELPVRRHAEPPRPGDIASMARAATHRVVCGAVGNPPAGLEFVEVFHVQGVPIRLYRSPDAIGPRSAFEEATVALGSGDLRGARLGFLRLLRSWPMSGAAWTAMGLTLLRSEEPQPGAFQCLLRAVHEDPARVAAHVGLASIYRGEGYGVEALRHLEQAKAADPENDSLAEAVLRLRVDLARQARAQSRESAAGQ